ncbi:MAG: DUF507 family protein [Thermodesulfovibrionales bacterium]|nr:DUF507 family protein [Thermodesulfovibrionales bacterium]
MRIPKSWVPVIAKKIVANISKKNIAQFKWTNEAITEEIERIMLEELSVEDKLNEEVRELLKKYETEIERGKVDYRKLFEMTKTKLIKERNIII